MKISCLALAILMLPVVCMAAGKPVRGLASPAQREEIARKPDKDGWIYTWDQYYGFKVRTHYQNGTKEYRMMMGGPWYPASKLPELQARVLAANQAIFETTNQVTAANAANLQRMQNQYNTPWTTPAPPTMSPSSLSPARPPTGPNNKPPVYVDQNGEPIGENRYGLKHTPGGTIAVPRQTQSRNLMETNGRTPQP